MVHPFLYAVGTLLGAMTGALIGQETESGFIRGAAVGAISGAVFSIEVFEYFLLLWQSDESGVRCLLYLVSSSVILRSLKLLKILTRKILIFFCFVSLGKTLS